MSSQQTGTAVLVVDNFSQQTSFKQIRFSFVGMCTFGIFPKIDTGEHGLATDNLYVYWHSFDDKPAKVHFKVSILSDSGEKLYTTEYNWELGTETNGNRPIVAFISRAKLWDPEKGFLVNGKLTLLCEAKTIDQEQKNFYSVPQSDMNLSENLQSLLRDGKFSDVTLIVGGTDDKKEFNVHKNILSARSPVFAAMFEHDCEEKRLNEVKITDIDPETCDELLVYIYTGKVKQMDSYALDLLQAADKYQLDYLKNICEDFLCSKLSIESAANALFIADLHGAAKLKDKCLGYICEKIQQVKDTDGWKILESNSKLLCDLLFYKNK